jgi:hypothetical protein
VKSLKGSSRESLRGCVHTAMYELLTVFRCREILDAEGARLGGLGTSHPAMSDRDGHFHHQRVAVFSFKVMSWHLYCGMCANYGSQ